MRSATPERCEGSTSARLGGGAPAARGRVLMPSRRALRILGAVAAVTVSVWIAVELDLARLDPAAIAERTRALGAFGPIAFFGLFVVQCIVAPLPSEPVMMAAGYVYGTGGGFLVGWIGVVVGASVCFLLARALGRPFVERFVSARRLDALDDSIGVRGVWPAFLVLLAIRLFAFTSFDVVSYACGLVRLPFAWFAAATALGVVPKVFAFTYLGANASAERPAWLDWTIAIGTLGVVLALPWIARAIRGSRRVDSPAARSQ
jgi:uncharacterized membrane protein YdjX (TVP38/TMEM64 family)